MCGDVVCCVDAGALGDDHCCVGGEIKRRHKPEPEWPDINNQTSQALGHHVPLENSRRPTPRRRELDVCHDELAMAVAAQPAPAKVYTVNGAASGSSSSLPDWLTRKRAAKAKGKRAVREHVEGTIELIQDFEFPEASNRIKTTRDGHHVIATGTYKPQMRVYDLDELTLKFERHSDAENVDFIVGGSGLHCG